MKVKTIIDPQIFLPLQAGRISDEVAIKIISKGKSYIKDLAEETKQNPVRIVSSSSRLTNWLVENLKKSGIIFSDDSAVLPMKELVETYYKKYDTDILLSTLSVASGDPDGIYHALGKNGSLPHL